MGRWVGGPVGRWAGGQQNYNDMIFWLAIDIINILLFVSIQLSAAICLNKRIIKKKQDYLSKVVMAKHHR